MLFFLKQLNRTLNHHIGVLLLGGLIAVALQNWRLWRRDQALAKRLRAEHPPIPQLTHVPKVSALVAAWNEAEHIVAHIESFLALDYPNSELVLCAGGGDETLAIAQRFANERIIILEQRPGEGKQKSLARCFERASGEIIYLTDADCLFDDEALVRLLAPIVNEGEQAATGGSRPLKTLLSEPFVVAQAVSDLRIYSEDTAPKYLASLLGRNCAIDRTLLDRAGALAMPAPTGTDYVLAKELTAIGARICQVRESQVETEYPTNAYAYVRQRRRWLRNVALHGKHYSAWKDVQASLKTSSTGLVMLALPLIGLCFGTAPLLIWLLILVHGWLARLRYLYFAWLVRGWPFDWRHSLTLLGVLLLDFVAWATPIIDYVSRRRHTEW